MWSKLVLCLCVSVCGLSWFSVSLCVVYAHGRVCISILHAPGDDPMGYECVSVCALSWFSVSLCVVYADGRVCISILHAPGDDPMGYECLSVCGLSWFSVCVCVWFKLVLCVSVCSLCRWSCLYLNTTCSR